MAVVQISRIQIRRGQANQGTGLPQLASGEMAWAIDAQELYIGNGSVSEGAPAVGITKVLTQNDLSAQGNLLRLLQYGYKTNDPTIITGTDVNHPVIRGLQDRLDDRVTTVEFGSAGDGTVDDTLALQRAINQLFLNPNNKASAQTAAGTSARVLLQIPAGVYVTSKPIYVPSYATIVGSGAEKTIIRYNPTSTIIGATLNNGAVITTTSATALMQGASISGAGIPANATVINCVPGVSLTISANATSTASSVSLTIILNKAAIQFVSDTSTVNNYILEDSNPGDDGSVTLGVYQPRYIAIHGMTIESVTGQSGCLQLNSVRNSVFSNINLKGNWTVPATLNANAIGILMQGPSALVTCENNIFDNLNVFGFYYAVYSDADIKNNSFINSRYSDCRHGFALGLTADGASAGQEFGARETIISNCKFEKIKQQAVIILVGTGNTVTSSRLINVGNNDSGVAGTQYPEIYFAQLGNTAKNIYSDRASNLLSSNLTYPYIPEVSGHGVYESFGTQRLIVSEHPSPTFAFRLPCNTDQYGATNGTIMYDIEYFYISSLADSFSRRGTLTLVADTARKRIQLSDEFDFAGVDPADTTALKLDFTANFLDQSGADYTGTGGQIVTSIAIKYSNTLGGDSGYLNYSYTANF
jgi:hypothetical protein